LQCMFNTVIHFSYLGDRAPCPPDATNSFPKRCFSPTLLWTIHMRIFKIRTLSFHIVTWKVLGFCPILARNHIFVFSTTAKTHTSRSKPSSGRGALFSCHSVKSSRMRGISLSSHSVNLSGRRGLPLSLHSVKPSRGRGVPLSFYSVKPSSERGDFTSPPTRSI